MSEKNLDTSDELEIEKIGQNFRPIVLKKTTKLEPDDYLYKLYQKSDLDTHQKIIVTIINSVLTQKRSSFTIDRDSLEELIKNDKNWQEPVGLDHNKYKTIIAKMCEQHFEEVQKGSGSRPSVYKVKSPSLSKRLNQSSEQALSDHKAAIEFVNKRKSEPTDDKSDNKTDSNSDTVCSSKTVVIKNEEVSSKPVDGSNLVESQNKIYNSKVFQRRTPLVTDTNSSEPELKSGSEVTSKAYNLEEFGKLVDQYGLNSDLTKNYFNVLLNQKKVTRIIDFENILWPVFIKHQPDGFNWYTNRFTEVTGRPS